MINLPIPALKALTHYHTSLSPAEERGKEKVKRVFLYIKNNEVCAVSYGKTATWWMRKRCIRRLVGLLQRRNYSLGSIAEVTHRLFQRSVADKERIHCSAETRQLLQQAKQGITDLILKCSSHPQLAETLSKITPLIDELAYSLEKKEGRGDQGGSGDNSEDISSDNPRASPERDNVSSIQFKEQSERDHIPPANHLYQVQVREEQAVEGIKVNLNEHDIKQALFSRHEKKEVEVVAHSPPASVMSEIEDEDKYSDASIEYSDASIEYEVEVEYGIAYYPKTSPEERKKELPPPPYLLLDQMMDWADDPGIVGDSRLQLIRNKLKDKVTDFMDVSSLRTIHAHIAAHPNRGEVASLLLQQLASSIDIEEASSWCGVGVDILLKGVIERFFHPSLKQFATALPHYLARFKRDAIISMVSDQGSPIIDWPKDIQWNEATKGEQDDYWKARRAVFQDIAYVRQFFLRNRGKNVLQDIFPPRELAILRQRIPQNGDSDEVYLGRLDRLFRIPQPLINLNMHDANKAAKLIWLLAYPLSLPRDLVGKDTPSWYNQEAHNAVVDASEEFIEYLNAYYFHPSRFAQQLITWVGDAQPELRSAATTFLMHQENSDGDELIKRGLIGATSRHPTAKGWHSIVYHFAKALENGSWEKTCQEIFNPSAE